MGYGMNRAGLYESGNDVFNYHTKDDIDAIENINLPDGKIRSLSETSNTNLSYDFGKFKGYAKLNSDGSLQALSTNGLREIGSTINKLRKVNSFNIGPLSDEDKPLAEAFLNTINKYNTGRDYMDSKWGMSNNIIAKTKSIISDATNQIGANRPVNSDNLGEGGDIEEAKDLKRPLIKSTSQKVPRPTRLPINLPFHSVRTLGSVNVYEIPFTKEASVRFNKYLPGMCNTIAYDYINEYSYFYINPNTEFSGINKIVIESIFEYPHII